MRDPDNSQRCADAINAYWRHHGFEANARVERVRVSPLNGDTIPCVVSESRQRQAGWREGATLQRQREGGGVIIFHWTDERVETLKTMWAEGHSCSQIAKHFGEITRNAVIGKVHRLGLKRATPTNRPPTARTPTLTRRDYDNRRRLSMKAKATEKKELRKQPKDIPLTPAPDASLLVGFWDVHPHHCRWPVGDPSDIDAFRYCGADRHGERSFCAFHHGIAYEPARVPLEKIIKYATRLAA
jgi:GcrA cell cycle regulator